MRIKKFTGSSMKEVLLLVKNELGDNALILKTRKLPRKLFALTGEDQVEVTAAVDDSGVANIPPLLPITMAGTGVYARPRPEPAVPTYAPAVKKDTPSQSQSSEERFRILELREDIREVKDLLKSILQTGETSAAGGFAGSWAVLYKRLTDAEIKQDVAEELVRHIKNTSEIPDTDIEKKFVSVLGGYVPVSGPLKQKKNGALVVAFVGPTGSGKTTTLAKLAAHCRLEKNMRVSIITADTYRIAAIEQVRTFADIVNIGLQVIFSPEEAEPALRACEHDDIVFIDTAGRSQKNTGHMRDLEKMIAALSPDEVHLVLSAGTKESDLNDIIRRYRECRVNRLLFTKLDETVRLGNIFNVVSRAGIPVSYFTNGQSVPDDITLAQPGRFVQQLWEGSSV